MLWLLENGGWIVYLLLGISIVAVAVSIHKFAQIKRALSVQKKFLDRILDLLSSGNVKKAYRESSENAPEPVGDIVLAGIKRAGSTREEILSVLEERSTLDMQKYEKGLGVLATIAHISPLLGLLGTVIGMIMAFISVQESTASGMAVQAGDLSHGIWQALLTTAAGLTVAIITYLLHNYLLSLRDRLFNQLEDRSLALANRLSRFKKRKKPASKQTGSGEEAATHEAGDSGTENAPSPATTGESDSAGTSTEKTDQKQEITEDSLEEVPDAD